MQSCVWREQARKMVDWGRVWGVCSFVSLRLISRSLETQKRRRGVKERTCWRDTKRKACLLVCVIVLTWLVEKENDFFISFLSAEKEEGGEEKGGMVDGKERQCWLRLRRQDSQWMKKRVKQHELLAACLRVYSVQGVQRSTVIKRPQKTAMRKREGAIKERKERALNYWTAYLAVYAAICTLGPEPI